MFCEKCGTKNEKDARFCGNCGFSLKNSGKKPSIKGKENSPKASKMMNKLKELPKKTKIIMASVILIVIVFLIILGILLGNPIKKAEDYLKRYYDNYGDNNNKELIEIGKILKSNKNDQKVLNSIKENTRKSMSKWVKNFNIEYKDKKELKSSYEKVSNALKDIYDYFNGLEYMLESKDYNDYREELSTLYKSKENYLSGKEYEASNNNYYAYYNYQKVDEKDCYYNKAHEFVNNYIKTEMESLKTKLSEFDIKDDASNSEKLEANLTKLKYLTNNKVSNNIDLSSSEEYQRIYNDLTKNIVELTKKVVEALDKELDYSECLKVINTSLEALEKDSDAYKDILELKKNYEDKKPDSLISKYAVSKTNGTRSSSYSKKINNQEYENYISFEFNGKTESIIYRLNNEYKTFKTKIVIGEDWDKDFNGYFVIYGDDKELYKSETITKTSEIKKAIELKVENIDDLKIEFVTTSKATGWNNFYIYLVEPYLYK